MAGSDTPSRSKPPVPPFPGLSRSLSGREILAEKALYALFFTGHFSGPDPMDHETRLRP